MAKKLNNQWLTNGVHSDWIARCKTSQTSYHCRVCDKTNDLGNMGKSALKIHVTTANHIENMKEKEAVQNSFKPSITCTFEEPASSSSIFPKPSTPPVVPCCWVSRECYHIICPSM